MMSRNSVRLRALGHALAPRRLRGERLHGPISCTPSCAPRGKETKMNRLPLFILMLLACSRTPLGLHAPGDGSPGAGGAGVIILLPPDGSGTLTTYYSGPFTSISAGYECGCGVMADKTISCWGGEGEWGECAPPAGTFISVAVGNTSTCGVRTDGTISCWGNADALSAPLGGTFTSVGAEGFVVCGVRTDSTIDCWGGFAPTGDLTPPLGTFLSVAVGDYDAVCGVRTDGTIACWGPTNVGAIDVADTVPNGTFTSVSTEGLAACGVRTDGTITCWGDQPPIPPTGTFTSVSVGDIESCGVRTDGTITCWGSTISQSEPPPGTFTSVSIGTSEVCALGTDGSVTCWQLNQPPPPLGCCP